MFDSFDVGSSHPRTVSRSPQGYAVVHFYKRYVDKLVLKRRETVWGRHYLPWAYGYLTRGLLLVARGLELDGTAPDVIVCQCQLGICRVSKRTELDTDEASKREIRSDVSGILSVKPNFRVVRDIDVDRSWVFISSTVMHVANQY